MTPSPPVPPATPPPADLLRRLWRRLYWARDDWRLRRQYRGTRHLVYFGGDGIGDELLLTTVLHELRRRGATGLGVMTRCPELFAQSPDVDHVLPMRHDQVAGLRRIGRRVDQLVYIDRQLPPDIDVPPAGHIVAEMCRRAGIRGAVSLRPYLWLRPEEREWAAPHHDAVVIQSSRRSASLAIGNKEWEAERFQQVVDLLRRDHRVIQVGLPQDPPLEGVTDLRGRTTLRQTAAVLAQAQAFIGLVGFLMHLARAVDCPAVIVYGGREHPEQSGYVGNENLFTALPCAPCWRWNSCDFERRCMTEITAADVHAALPRLLARRGHPLAAASTVLP